MKPSTFKGLEAYRLAHATFRDSGVMLGRGCCCACHRSQPVCIPSQKSGVVPSHADKRSAMLAVMFALPCSRLESVTRLTLSALAACVTGIASGIHSRNTSPGCAGLCIFMSDPLVIVLVIDQFGILADKSEGQTPISIEPHRPVLAQVISQRMKSPIGGAHVLRSLGVIQCGEQDAQLTGVMGLDACLTTGQIKRLKTLVPKASDHDPIVACKTTSHNPAPSILVHSRLAFRHAVPYSGSACDTSRDWFDDQRFDGRTNRHPRRYFYVRSPLRAFFGRVIAGARSRAPVSYRAGSSTLLSARPPHLTMRSGSNDSIGGHHG